MESATPKARTYRILDPQSAQLAAPDMALWRAVQGALYAIDVTSCTADWLRRSGRDGDVQFNVRVQHDDGTWRVRGVRLDPKDHGSTAPDDEYRDCIETLFSDVLVGPVDAKPDELSMTRVEVPYTVRALCRRAPEGAALFAPLSEEEADEDDAPAFSDGAGSYKLGCVRPRYGVGWCECGYWSYGYCWCMSFGQPDCDFGGTCQYYGCY